MHYSVKSFKSKEPTNNRFYCIPINIHSLDTVDFTECDPMLRITTLWFSESISPLSETDDVVHNVFLNTNTCGIRTSFISHRTKFTCFKMKSTNPTPKHKRIFLMHFE